MERVDTVLEIEDGIAVITINRPAVLNAARDETLFEIEDILKELEDREDVLVVILTGAGEKSFCAGHDISTFGEMSEYEIRKAETVRHQVTSYIQEYGKPVIAAVNGYAFGLGCELACSCDFRLASQNARFSLPEVSLGIIPGNGGTQRLPRLIGKGPAMYYTVTKQHLFADRAYQLGLVEEVLPVSELLDRARSIAKKIAECSPSAVRIVRNAINRGLDTDLNTGLSIETESFISAYRNEDRREGVAAFLEKRKAVFGDK